MLHAMIEHEPRLFVSDSTPHFALLLAPARIATLILAFVGLSLLPGPSVGDAHAADEASAAEQAPAAKAAPAANDDAVQHAPGRIEFLAKTPLFDARGSFLSWRFTEIAIDPANPRTSYVDVEVDVASVDTGIGRRDAHLRRDDFFDVENFPTATVRVQDVAADGEDASGQTRYRASFLLNIRGVEKSVPGHFVVTGLAPPTVKGELTIDRLDFGINKPKSRWNPMSIDEQIPLTFEAVVPADPLTGASLLGS